MKASAGDRTPMSVDSPILPQFPPSENTVNTSLALLRGAKTHSGIRMARKPKMCSIRIVPSTIGSCLTNTVLKIMAMTLMAITNRVPCHCLKT